MEILLSNGVLDLLFSSVLINPAPTVVNEFANFIENFKSEEGKLIFFSFTSLIFYSL